MRFRLCAEANKPEKGKVEELEIDDFLGGGYEDLSDDSSLGGSDDDELEGSEEGSDGQMQASSDDEGANRKCLQAWLACSGMGTSACIKMTCRDWRVLERRGKAQPEKPASLHQQRLETGSLNHAEHHACSRQCTALHGHGRSPSAYTFVMQINTCMHMCMCADASDEEGSDADDEDADSDMDADVDAELESDVEADESAAAAAGDPVAKDNKRLRGEISKHK